jgi:hypothetical protein
MKLRPIVAAVAIFAGVSSSHAAQVTVSGLNFDITFDTGLLGLFGTPSVVGDEVFWFPSGSPGFTAKTEPLGISVKNSTFALTVTAHPGYQLASFGLVEGGDYFYFGAGAGVSASGQLRVTPLTPVPGSTASSQITPTGPFVGNPLLDLNTTNWSATAGPIVVVPGTTAANVSIQNILGAWANPALFPTYAFIEKKEAVLTVGVTLIPEPETYALMLAGLGVVGFVASRRRARV